MEMNQQGKQTEKETENEKLQAPNLLESSLDSISNSFHEQPSRKGSGNSLRELFDFPNSHQSSDKNTRYESFLADRILIIEGPELVTENMIKSYKLYKIKTIKKLQRGEETCVSRRFSDFEYLQKQLLDSHGGCIIPLLPEKNIWANVNLEGQEEVKNRIKALQNYLKSLLAHKKLRISQPLRSFLFDDEIAFSEKKGEYYSKMKTQQKIKQIATTAYSASKGFVYKLLVGDKKQKLQYSIHIQKPTADDIKLTEFQRQIADLINVINSLRRVVENSVIEMRTINTLLPERGEEQINPMQIMDQFEDLSIFIYSCNQALSRRSKLRISIDQLSSEIQECNKKIKSNPRSQQMDLLRNKLAKSIEKCQKWTGTLVQQLLEGISVGKSMIQVFTKQYTQRKQYFYQ